MKEHSVVKRTKTKKILFVFAIIIAFITSIIIINFIPTFSLKTRNMSLLEGNWVNVYYEGEKEAAEDVFQYAESETEQIAKKLGFTEKQDVNVYIYDEQNTMQMKKYGLIAPLLGLDWYIGDNIKTNVILTSPANPGKEHTYDNIKYAVLHEIVHAYVSVMNSHIQLWLTEGVALYLSNGDPLTKDMIDNIGIPSYENTQTSNPITFSNCGGYSFAHIYIEYLEKEYGWDKVLELLQTEDYEKVFGKSSEDIYKEWVVYLENYE